MRKLYNLCSKLYYVCALVYIRFCKQRKNNKNTPHKSFINKRYLRNKIAILHWKIQCDVFRALQCSAHVSIHSNGRREIRRHGPFWTQVITFIHPFYQNYVINRNKKTPIFANMDNLTTERNSGSGCGFLESSPCKNGCNFSTNQKMWPNEIELYHYAINQQCYSLDM